MQFVIPFRTEYSLTSQPNEQKIINLIQRPLNLRRLWDAGQDIRTRD